jgi:hypothetical protein
MFSGLVLFQSILLSIHPHPGDTLRMRYDQRVETVATTQRGHADTTTSVVSTLLVLTHTIVESSDSAGSDLVAVTDSVAATSSGGRAPESADAARQMLEGKRVHLWLSPDGTTVCEDPEASPELRALFASMPAIFPKQPTAVGHRWKREMTGPVGGAIAGDRGDAKATFRLDSISRGGDVAYVSLKGTLSHVSDGPAARGESSGTVTGRFLLDLKRGWLTESRARIEVTSLVRAKAATMRIKMIVTQWLRAIDSRDAASASVRSPPGV